MKNTVVSGRYAQALFELASEQNQIDKYNSDLKLLAVTMAESTELKRFMTQPIISSTDKKATIKTIFGDKVLVQIINFVSLLIERKREVLIEEISEAFEDMVNKLNSRVVAKVYTAVSLENDAVSLQKLKASLEKYLEKNVEIETHIDQNIMGGVLVKVGDRVIDGSLKTKFENLARSLA